MLGEVVDDGVVQEVRGHLQQERVRADGGRDVSGGLDGDAVLLREGEECLRRLLGHERQIDELSGERSLVGAGEHEQRLGELDAAVVDGAEPLDELIGVAVLIAAGDLEQRLRDRQWGAQLVGRVGGEPPLFGDVGLEPVEHGVERVGQFTELVLTALQLDPMGERTLRRDARGLGDPDQGREHATGEEPATHETDHQQQRQHRSSLRSELVQEVGPDGEDPGEVGVRADDERTVGDVAQEEHPHRPEQQGAGEHEEPGVAEGELEAHAQPRLPDARWPPSRVGSGPRSMR